MSWDRSVTCGGALCRRNAREWRAQIACPPPLDCDVKLKRSYLALYIATDIRVFLLYINRLNVSISFLSFLKCMCLRIVVANANPFSVTFYGQFAPILGLNFGLKSILYTLKYSPSAHLQTHKHLSFHGLMHRRGLWRIPLQLQLHVQALHLCLNQLYL